jgi:NADH:ubiquinone oxidoreductase subunit 4 (subunit M)
MIESSFIFLISLLGAFLIFILKNREISKLIALFSVSITFFVTLYIYLQLERNIDGFQFVTLFSWIPQWALHFSTGLDRLNAPFVFANKFYLSYCGFAIS